MLIARNGATSVVVVVNGRQTIVADRYDWYKRLPGQPEKMLSVKGSIFTIPVVHFHDEGYYCCLAYYQDQLQHKGCFKLIVLGKCVIPNLIDIIYWDQICIKIFI